LMLNGKKRKKSDSWRNASWKQSKT